MKLFQEIPFDIATCRVQLSEFRALLDQNATLSERDEVLPFFRSRVQLSALFAKFNRKIAWPDRIAYEFDMFGDYVCDLAVGQRSKGEYCFIEFEDAEANSIFKQQGKKATREWSSRFDHGFSQIVNWCHKLADSAKSVDHLARFDLQTINFEAVLVIGRDAHISVSERERLKWRTDYITVNSKRIYCMTFDELYDQLGAQLEAASMFSSGVAPTPENPG